jgi:hypothetical protein
MTDEHIISYLLQELSEEEAERFEEQCFSQEEWPADLDAAEQDLIDAYLHNELSKERRRRFEEKYLITDVRKARVLTAQSFMQVLCPPRKKTIKERLEVFWQQPLVPQAAVAVLIVAVLTPIVVFLMSTKTYSRVDLAMGSLERGVGPQMERVTLPLSTNGLEIHLKLPEPDSAAAYRVEWENAKGNLGGLKIESQDNQSIVVRVGANQLSPGRYVLKLSKTKNGETEQPVGSYFFRVE